MLKSKLHYYDRSNKMWSIIESRQDNDMTYRTGVISAEYDSELLRLIRQCAVYDEVKIG